MKHKYDASEDDYEENELEINMVRDAETFQYNEKLKDTNIPMVEAAYFTTDKAQKVLFDGEMYAVLEYTEGGRLKAIYNKEASWLYAELCAHKNLVSEMPSPVVSDMSSPSSPTFWGRHVFLIFPDDVGEDMSSLSSPRCWGRHLVKDIRRCWGRQEHWGRH